MGFNFGAFLGGAADQIVKDLDEQEKEVKLRTRTILDRQIAETAANRKEYKANKKKVTEQLNALIPLFGDDKNAIAKARSIVAGGDTHFTNMLNMLQNHKLKGGDANTIVKFAPDAEVSGFKNVEDATGSLVQMANIPAPTFGKKDDTPSAFGLDMGTSLYRGYYEKARKEYVDAGLLDATKTEPDSAVVYATAEVDLSGLKQDTKSLADQKAELVSKVMDIEDKSSDEAKAINAKIATIDSYIMSGSAALAVAKENNKNEGKGLTVTQHLKILSTNIKTIEDEYKSPTKILSIGQDKVDDAKVKAIEDFKINYVKGMIRKGMDSNAFDLITSDPSLNTIYENIQQESLKIKEKNEAFDKNVDLAKSTGSAQAYINSLPANRKADKAKLKLILDQAFPNENIDALLNAM